jgi:deoxyadenosine/deoxycytidine kinase
VLYEKVVGWMELDVMKPDIVVVLQATTDVLMERIGKRGRPFERDMDRAYIANLNDAYNHYFFHYNESPVLIVNTNGIDFVNNAEDFEDLRERIVTHRQGTTYYTPIERGTTT